MEKKKITTPHKMIVVKRKGKKQAFSKAKIKSGILKACVKTKMPAKKLTKIVKSIEEEVQKKGEKITSKAIGNIVLDKLKKADKMAFIRFASVFEKNVSNFKKRIRGL